MRTRLAALGLSLVASGLAWAAAPKNFSADYRVYRNGELLGQANLSYQGDTRGGRFRSQIHGTEGLAALAGIEIEESSQLRWRGDTPETVDYRYQQDAAWNSRERRVSVDARAGRIVSTDKGRQYSFAYQPGVVDRNAITLALMQALAKGAREVTLTVVDRDKLGPQRYAVTGQVRLHTALGKRSALRVERRRESANGKSTVLWFDRERGGLPLRILQTEGDGETLDLRIAKTR